MYTVYSIISVTRNGRTSPYRHLAIPISPKVSRNRTEQSIMTDPKEWIYLYPTIDRRGFQKERERERERDRGGRRFGLVFGLQTRGNLPIQQH